MKGRAIAITGGFRRAGPSRRGSGGASRRFRRGDRPRGAPPDGLAERLAPDALMLGGVDLSSAEGARERWPRSRRGSGGSTRWSTSPAVSAGKASEEGDPATWERLFALNVKTAFNASRAALPYLLESGAGRIVNVGANAAVKAGAGMGPYAASKAGVHRLTESLAEELKNRGVTVNAVLPSIIDTPANRAEMPKADFDRWVAPADLAAVILFLASDEARAVTGALVPVTGGV